MSHLHRHLSSVQRYLPESSHPAPYFRQGGVCMEGAQLLIKPGVAKVPSPGRHPSDEPQTTAGTWRQGDFNANVGR